jgi:hypothetical protein
MNEIDIKEMDRPQTEERNVTRKERGQHVNGPKHPWQVEIDVYLNSVGPGPDDVDFEVDTCLPTEPDLDDPKHPRVDFKNEGRDDGFTISFRLFDNTNGGLGSNYRFPLNASDGVWSQVGHSCPTTATYGVFPEDSLDVKDKGLTLVACNPNPPPGQGHFKYTLNVSTTGNPPYVRLDPGGNNMNGGGALQ